MSDATGVSMSLRRVAPQRFAHSMFLAGSALAMLVAPLHPSGAQEPVQNVVLSVRPWTLRFTSGALVGTGAQRNSFKDAQLSAVGLAWRVAPSLSITGTFSWARSRVLDVADRGKVDVFNSDLGIEAESKEWSSSGAVRLRLFAGAGAGVRSYHYRASTVDATNHPAGYLALGGDVGVGRVGIRMEARDYASRFNRSLSGGTAVTRNDLVISAGLYFKKRPAAQG